MKQLNIRLETQFSLIFRSPMLSTTVINDGLSFYALRPNKVKVVSCKKLENSGGFLGWTSDEQVLIWEQIREDAAGNRIGGGYLGWSIPSDVIKYSGKHALSTWDISKQDMVPRNISKSIEKCVPELNKWLKSDLTVDDYISVYSSVNNYWHPYEIDSIDISTKGDNVVILVCWPQRYAVLQFCVNKPVNTRLVQGKYYVLPKKLYCFKGLLSSSRDKVYLLLKERVGYTGDKTTKQLGQVYCYTISKQRLENTNIQCYDFSYLLRETRKAD